MPGLQKQAVPVILKGLDTKSDPKTAPLGALAVLENLYQTQAGRWQKRNGVTALTRNILGGGSIAAGAKLSTYDDQLLQSDGSNLYTYSPQATAWQGRGTTTPIGIRAEKVAGDVSNTTMPASAISGNLLCYIETHASDGTHVSVIDTNTGAILMNDVWTGTGGTTFKNFVIALASRFVIFLSTTGSGIIQAFTIDYAAPTTLSGSTTIVSDAGATANMDVTRNGSNDSALLAYHSTAANHLKIQVVNSNLTLGSVVGNTDVPDQAIGWLNWDYSNGKGYLAYVGAASGAKLLDVQQSALSITATTTIDAAVTACRNVTGYRSGSTPNVLIDIASGVAPCYTKIRRWNGSGASSVWQLGMGLASKVFKSGSRFCVACVYQSNTTNTGQNTCFLLDPTAATPVIMGKALYGLAGPLNPNTCCLADPPAQTATVSLVPVTRFSFGDSLIGLVYDAYNLRVDFAATMSQFKRIGDSTLIPGGAVRAFDGAIVTEHGHFLWPEITSYAGSAGGSLTASGTYQLTACYVWVDHRGQEHFGPIAPPQTVTLTAGQGTLSWTIAYSRISDKPAFNNSGNNMYVQTYLTAGNGKTFFRVAQQFNAPTTDSFAGGMSAADTTFNTNPTLYTTGGVLPHIPAPPAKLVEVSNNRAFLAGTDNPLELWPSMEYSVGQGVVFSDATVITVEAEGGDITALGEMDDKIVIFKRSAIYIMTGAGPDLEGNGNYPQPQKISTKVGATIPTIQKTSDGLVFKSAKGFYLLTRGLDVQYIGAQIEAYNALNVTDVVTIDDQNQVRFFTDSGRTLVYDWFFRCWYTFTGQTAVSAALWKNGVVYVDSTGVVQQEVAGQYNDNGSAIISKLQTTWLSMAQLFGFQRLYQIQMLVEAFSTHTYQVQLAVDWNPTVVDTQTIAETAASPIPLEMRPKRQQLQAIQMTIQDSFGAAGQGFTFSGMGLLIGVKPGMGHRPAVQRLA